MSRRTFLVAAAAILLLALAAWRLLALEDRAGDRVAAPRPGAGPTAAAGQPAATPPLESPPEPEAGGLEIAVDAGGVPMAEARVRVYLHRPIEPGTGRPGWRLAGEIATGADGLARAAAAPGAYLVSARAEGWAPGLETVVRPSGERTTRLAIHLVAPVALEGRTVARAGGDPVPAATLVLSRHFERGAPRGDLPVEERVFAVSDGTGRFRLAPLAPGLFGLEAEAGGRARRHLDGISVPHAGPLEVVLGAAGLVEGQVLDPAGAPAAGAEIALSGGEQVLTATAGPGGGFALEVPPRAYRVSARRGDGAASLTAPVAVAAGQAVRGLVLRLGSPATLRGQVVDRAGGPVVGASVGLSPAGEAGELGRAVTGGDGRFAFPGLAPGAYDLDATATGRGALTRRGLVVQSGEAFEATLVLAGNGAVEGQVSDAVGRGVEGARVRARRLRADIGAADAEAVTGADGRYRLSSVEPGRVSLRAARAGAGAGPSILAVVEEGLTTRADFTLEETGTLEGTVRTAAGQPPAEPIRAVVMGGQSSPGGGPGGGTGRGPGRAMELVAVDPAGHFQIELPAGPWQVTAAGLGGGGPRAVSAGVEVRAGAVVRVDLQLEEEAPGEAPATLSVEVLEPGGAPSPFAEVITQRAGVRRPRVFPADELGRLVLPLAGGEIGQSPLSVGARNGGRTAPLALVPPGTPEVAIQLAPGGLLRGQVTSGGAPLPGSTLELSPGDEPQLAGAGGLERELAGAAFSFSDLAPGTWLLTATTPDGRTGRATATVAAGAETTLAVEVAPGASVNGRVVDAQGAPQAGASVSAGDRDTGAEVTGRDGRFRIEGVAPGRAVTVRAFVPRVGGVVKTVELAPGQRLDLGDLALSGPTPSGHGHP